MAGVGPGAGILAAELARRTIERRAVEAAIWGMPAVNYDLMLQEMLTKTAGKADQVIYWAARANWLPAPEGQFALIVRAYVPTEPILDGD